MTDSPKTDINRIKVVLVEQKGRQNGLPSNCIKTKQPFLNGVQTPFNQG